MYMYTLYNTFYCGSKPDVISPMSLSAFVAGVALGGLRYGAVKFQLLERESVVLYSVHQVKESFHGDAHVRFRTLSPPKCVNSYINLFYSSAEDAERGAVRAAAESGA